MSQSPFVVVVDVHHSESIHDYLCNQGCIVSKPAHTFFQAKKPGLCVTFYKSGKLLVTGKQSDEFIEFYLEPEILQQTGVLKAALPSVKDSVKDSEKIGSDEAGKGDYFGPLSVCSTYASYASIDQLYALGIKDSKKITDDNILILEKEIRKLCQVETVVLMPEKYNELYKKIGNLNHLLAWAHTTAATNLVEKSGCNHVLVDQFAKPALLESFFAKKSLKINLSQRVRAEEDIVVAAASIVARAEFLKGLKALATKFHHPLPKGASSAVIKAGCSFVEKIGKEKLHLVAKIHFKTTQNVLDLGNLF
ncbi:ribonuclease HIII [Candidatus Aerophobetes bacterium]|uniref:Ribonuclease HIII n=1 Tax=Aerophobetes bacterium TaxID=2030807 RepID=A0A2A4X0W1_UNCAE|nr:MAG: ribonuclease HIII [Candidatus Aerophobetes bacterium]